MFNEKEPCLGVTDEFLFFETSNKQKSPIRANCTQSTRSQIHSPFLQIFLSGWMFSQGVTIPWCSIVPLLFMLDVKVPTCYIIHTWVKHLRFCIHGSNTSISAVSGKHPFIKVMTNLCCCAPPVTDHQLIGNNELILWELSSIFECRTWMTMLATWSDLNLNCIEEKWDENWFRSIEICSWLWHWKKKKKLWEDIILKTPFHSFLLGDWLKKMI